MNVTEMQARQAGLVRAIHGGRGLIKRLEAMGIRPGVQIIKLSGQLMKGPVIVQVKNTQVALGYGMARKIEIDPVQ